MSFIDELAILKDKLSSFEYVILRIPKHHTLFNCGIQWRDWLK